MRTNSITSKLKTETERTKNLTRRIAEMEGSYQRTISELEKQNEILSKKASMYESENLRLKITTDRK